MKRFLSILAACLVLGSAAVLPASAAAPPDDGGIAFPNYEEKAKAYGYLSINASKDALCQSDVEGIEGKTTKIVVIQTLQMQDGLSWRRVTDWTATYYTWKCSFSNTRYSLNGGSYYRVKTEARVYEGSSYVTVYGYSNKVPC